MIASVSASDIVFHADALPPHGVFENGLEAGLSFLSWTDQEHVAELMRPCS